MEQYARLLADQLGLKDWEIKISDQYCSEGNKSTVGLINGQKRAMIYLSKEFHNDSLEEQRETLIHELLHCHHAIIDQYLYNLLDDKDYKQYANFREFAVDGVAAAIAHHFPLRLTCSLTNSHH